MLPRIMVILGLGVSALAQPLEIRNDYGSVHVEVITGNRVSVWRAGAQDTASDDIAVRRSPVSIQFDALPQGDEPVDIEAHVPLGAPFNVVTEDGDITIVGMVRKTEVRSLTGALTIEAPLDITRVNISSSFRPSSLDLPKPNKFMHHVVVIRPRLTMWSLFDKLRSPGSAYGEIRVQLHKPAVLTIRNWPMPEDWPLKPHTDARDSVERLLAQAELRRHKGSVAAPQRDRLEVPETLTDVTGPQTGNDALFTSEVRMVNMSVAVSDSEGRPLTGLSQQAFSVEEDNVQQKVQVVDPEESPFNMAILLDLSGSTSLDLGHIREAVIRLIDLAGSHDRIAIYAMAGGMFHRLVALTTNHELVRIRSNRLPYPSGGSPLWDAIMLSYDEELDKHSGERNALIVISDGIDNRISEQALPSVLRASRLIQAAGEMDVRIYPIFLLSGERFGRNWSGKAYKQLDSLAKKTGGRVFSARSVADIEPVLPLLAQEMRSVYGIAYYPSNQVFNGDWRKVKIRVNQTGAQVRARPGYFAE